MPVLKSSESKAALLTVSLVFSLAPAAFSEETTEAVAQTADFASKVDLAKKTTITTKADFGGKAAFYSSDLHGRRTASGQPYDEGKMTAAHKQLPFGTKVTVVNRKNGKSCTLTINDRGPYAPNHVIDVSKAAAKELGLMSDNKRMVDCYIKIDARDFIKKQTQKDKVKVAAQPEGETL